METLAIIAYKQPILRQEVERLRGVDCGGILKTLLEKDLIRIMGRKSLPGRPLIYGTTRKFLEVFDLRDLSSLPKLKEIEDLGGDEAQTEPLTQETVRPDTAGAQEDESTENPDENGSGAGTPGSPRSA
jgi:segregation and condensation protein B